MNRRDHWDQVYRTKRPEEVSWFQPSPEQSLRFIQDSQVPPDAGVIDVGAGTSLLVANLLARGFTDVSVLDVSALALSESKRRLGARGEAVEWINADLTTFEPARSWDLWHDRAVFHFLTDPADRAAYLQALDRALAPRGHVVMATFGPAGPERCSGLEVVRYTAQQLGEELGPGFELVDSVEERHTTPWGGIQQFVFGRFRRPPMGGELVTSDDRLGEAARAQGFSVGP